MVALVETIDERLRRSFPTVVHRWCVADLADDMVGGNGKERLEVVDGDDGAHRLCRITLEEEEA